MSMSCSELFSDQLSGEDSSAVFSLLDSDESPEYSSEDMDSVATLFEDERDLHGVMNSTPSPQSTIDSSLRADSVSWILKVTRYHGFQPLTAYVAVNYFDRFLYSHHLPKLEGWSLQLLSVACLSIAAKMEEAVVPSLLDLQIEAAKFIFEPRNVQRMELLVLCALDWRLRCISPFCYLGFFASKIDPSGIYIGFLKSMAKDIILSTIQESSFNEHRPSCVAASSIIIAANDLPKFSHITPQHAVTWSNGLIHKDNIMSCYQMIQKIRIEDIPKKQPKVIPHLRVMTRTSNISSSVTITSSSTSSSSKRRKLNNNSWEDDDKISSD